MANNIKSLDSLFISKVRIKAIKHFLFNDEPIHLRGAVRALREEINAVRRELSRLDAIGFVNSEKKGNKKFFTLNHDYPLLSELRSMFHKTFGLGGAISKKLSDLGDVKFAILTSDFTQPKLAEGHDQTVELVMVGEIDLKQLTPIVEEAEKKLEREIHYTVLTESEFTLRKKRRDPFVSAVVMDDSVLLAGKKMDLIS